VVFLQCAGQRDDSGKHLPYCSGHCCNTSIKQAMYFKDANPAIDTVVLYTDLRTPGMGEDFYRSGQTKGVTFTKGRWASARARRVRFRDFILDEDASIEADLVVLRPARCRTPG
jgi:quinone-modifying oxidoreductase subunit QmoB